MAKAGVGQIPIQNPMGKGNSPRLRRYLPQVILATFAVMILPVFVVWMVRAGGAIDALIPLMLLGTGISLALGWIGRRFWESRPGSGDLLFGELMVWGFVRRWRNERRLASAATLLGLDGHGAAVPVKDLSPKEQAELLEQLSESLEARDSYTSGHSRRVARHAAMIAKKLGLSPADVAKIRTAGVLHDVGKIDTPPEVLGKPGKLTDEEFDVIKEHPLRGAEMMLERHLDPGLATIVAHHHERLDGKGYPDGLRGDEIPIGARIIAVADTFDALTSSRPYRPARPHKKALTILNKEAGTQLDPDAVRAFTSHYSGMRPIAAWAFVTGFPQRVLYPLFGEGAAGGAISAAKVMAATAAAVGAGSAVAATSPIIDRVSSPPATAAMHAPAFQEGNATGPGAAHGGQSGNSVNAPGHKKDGSPGNSGSSNSGGNSEADGGSATGTDTGTRPETGSGSGSGNSGSGSGNSGSGSGNSGTRPGGSGNAPGHGGSGGGSGGSGGSGSGGGGSSNAGGNAGGNSGSGGSGGSGGSSGSSGHSNSAPGGGTANRPDKG